MWWPFKRKAMPGKDGSPSPESAPGWRRKKRGVPVPAKPGQAFDLRMSDGDEFYGLIAGRPTVGTSKDGFKVRHDGSLSQDVYWLRSAVQLFERSVVTHYRLHMPVSDERREDRQALFDHLRLNPAVAPIDQRPDLDRSRRKKVTT